MRRIIAISFMLFLIVGVGFFTLEGIPDPNFRHCPEDLSDTTVVTWDRDDIPCISSDKEKTTCTLGGDEQCTAQYCN